MVLGTSAGGVEALDKLLLALPEAFAPALLVVLHLPPSADSGLVDYFGRRCGVPVEEAEDKAPVPAGRVSFAPAGYHLLIERSERFALSIGPPVNYSRPSIDVLFQSAALAWGPQLLGILLTGASTDGAEGLRTIKAYGGATVAQRPAEATCSRMPQAGIDTGAVDQVLSLDEVRRLLCSMVG